MDGRPALSISVFSRLFHNQDLITYASQFSSAEELIGLMVADKTSDLKAEVTAVVGILRDHRTRLLALTKREEMRYLINGAADHESVFHLSTGRNDYDYIASALRIVLRTEDFRRFGINGREVTSIGV